MLIGHESASLPQKRLKRDTTGLAEAGLPDRSEDDALILDGTGTIRSCGSAVQALFGGDKVRLIGRRVSEFIPGLPLGGRSPSFSERYLMYLCASHVWRRFRAHDPDANEFAVEIKLSRIRACGQEVFALNLRRVAESTDA